MGYSHIPAAESTLSHSCCIGSGPGWQTALEVLSILEWMSAAVQVDTGILSHRRVKITFQCLHVPAVAG